ncbi:MAG: hypothetical protein ACLQVD_17860 [Capsulimonadaceae bacterium]
MKSDLMAKFAHAPLPVLALIGTGGVIGLLVFQIIIDLYHGRWAALSRAFPMNWIGNGARNP